MRNEGAKKNQKLKTRKCPLRGKQRTKEITKEYVASNQSTTLAVNLASGLLKKKTKVGGSLALTLRQ